MNIPTFALTCLITSHTVSNLGKFMGKNASSERRCNLVKYRLHNRAFNQIQTHKRWTNTDLCKEDNKYNEKDNKHNKYLNHKPPIGCDWLEVLKDLPVGCFYIQSCVINVTINPARGKQMNGKLVLMFPCDCSSSFPKLTFKLFYQVFLIKLIKISF